MGLLDLFVKSEPEQAAATTVPAAPAAAQLPASGYMPQQTVAATPAPGTVDQKFMKHFENILDRANFPGADFYEFSKTLDGMSAMQVPEEQTYKMAYIAFRSMNAGQTDAQLVDLLNGTANKYLEILKADKANFDSAVQKETGDKVGNLQQEVDRLNTRQTAIDQEIARLQEERQANQENLIKLGGDIAIQTSRIVSNHNNYNVSYETVVKAINGVLERIARYCVAG